MNTHIRGTSRRTFLKAGGASLALLGLSSRASATKRLLTKAVVIGSGIGGSIAALRLAQAGIQTIVVERGQRWPIVDPTTNSTFATFQSPDGRSSWFSPVTTDLIPSPIDSYPGVLELIDPTTTGGFLRNGLRPSGVAVRNGAGVGGRSIVDNAIMMQPSQAQFAAAFPTIDYAQMNAKYFPRVRSALSLANIPTDVLNSSYYGSTRANLTQAQNAGMFGGSLVEFAIDWDTVRAEIGGTRVPSAIDGQSWFGLNSGAKRSVDKNYLALAESAGATVMPLHVVTDVVETKKDKLYTVKANQIDADGTVLDTVEISAQYVFFAAGATGTPALLTKARSTKTLPRLNSFVGTDWGTNGGFIAVRGGLGNFLGGQGGPCGHFVFEDSATPFSPTSLVEIVIPKNFQLFALGNAPGFALYLGYGTAPGLGTFAYNSGTNVVTLNWPNADVALGTFSSSVNSMLNRLNTANPGSFTVFNSEDPSYKASGAPALTMHPIGGAVMGKATDTATGRLAGHQGLYVVDGSLIPGGSLGVDPTFTIGALVERNMEKILKAM